MASITPNPLYIPLFNIEEVILDKDTGLPLSGGIVSFFRDSQRATPKQVYKITGTYPNYTFVQAGAVLTLGLNGSFIDQNGDPFVPYAYPYDVDGAVDLYYVTVVSSGAVPQFTREAVPYLGQDTIPPEDRVSTENEILNSQFVEILFPESGTFTINVSGADTVTNIAPNWDIVSTGAGTITLERLQPTTQNTTTNPPYSLSITASAGLGSSVTLRQRLTNSPSIGRGKYASGSLVAAVIAGGSSAISMTYAPSTGSTTTVIPSAAVTTDGSYHLIANNALITQQNNSPADSGYIDINISIPTSRTIAISSIQLVFTPTSVDIPYDEQTSSLQKSKLFSWYEDSVRTQPKTNILVGWTFPQNPWQFVDKTSTTAIAAQTSYIADQTILHQESASAYKSNKADRTRNFGLQLTTVNGVNANRFAIIQYLDYKSVEAYWGKKLSAMVRCALYTDQATQTKIKMRLIYRTSAPPPLAAAEPITGWDANGDLTFAAGWTSISPLNDVAYTVDDLALLDTQDELNAYSFNQFQLPQAPGATTYLGVVIYITEPLGNVLAAEDAFVFSRVSLVPNDFAMDITTETPDDTLRRCQYYYEKSYDADIMPGAASASGQLAFQQNYYNTALTNFFPAAFAIQYNTAKNKVPTVTLYSPTDGSSGNVRAYVNSNNYVNSANNNQAVTNWTPNNNEKIAAYIPNGTGVATWPSCAAITAPQGSYILLQYVADARLG